MNETLQINTRVRRLFHYLDDFQKGVIRVPAFQRDFIWGNKEKLDLLDSIKRGYPIGSILFWRPNFKANSDFAKFESDKIGAYFIPKRSSDFFYILDGYQRISTLFGCLINPLQTELNRDETEWAKKFNIVYDLKEDKFEFYKHHMSNQIHKVPIYKFVDSKEFFNFQKELLNANLPVSVLNDYIQKYENLSSKLVDYQIPSIDIIGGSISEAVDIFSRVNSKGAKISDDWKVSALSFDKDKEFRLGSEIDRLLEDLKCYNFDKLKRKVILQCIINSFNKVFFDQSKPSKLEELARRDDFVEVTKQTFENLKKAVSFLHNEVLVLNSKLLPYNNQLIFITDFFSKIESPSEGQLSALRKWFWVTSYSAYFTIYNLSKQRLAYNRFSAFLDDSTLDPIFSDRPNQQFTISSFPSKINMGSVRAKSLALFMLYYQKFYLNISTTQQKYFMRYLFRYPSKDFDSSITQNTILILSGNPMDFTQNKGKDLSHLLDSKNDLKSAFISEEMKHEFHSTGDITEILNMRKKLIMSCEKTFVEEFGLIYGDN